VPELAGGGVCGSSGGIVVMSLLSWDVDDLELDPVRIVKETGVVAADIRPLLGIILDLEALRSRPAEPLVDDVAGRRLEREVVQPHGVPVVWLTRRRLRLPKAERSPDALAVEIEDRLPALAYDLVDLDEAERREQFLVERQTALERRDDEVEMVDTADLGHRVIVRRYKSSARP
jgi:hypothetical protein